LKFEAELLQDFGGAKAGNALRVELDLFGTPNPALASELPMQLLLGCSFPDAAALKEYLKLKPPAPPAQ
jgi:hypothetical protein